MAEPLGRILVIGSEAAFLPLFGYLEASRRYDLHYASDLKSVLLSDPRFDAVVLHVPEERASAEAALLRLEKRSEKIPVVCNLDSREQTRLHIAAMERGAFDYFTCYRSRDEVRRILDNAIGARKRQLPVVRSIHPSAKAVASRQS